MFIKPIEAESYELVRDKKRPIVGLRVNPVCGESFVIPMTTGTAAQIGELLIQESKEKVR